MISETIDNNEALAVFDVEVAHTGELLRAGGVQDLENARRVINLDLLPVEILNGRIVFLHETSWHELYRQSTFAHPARSQYHDLELSHFSGRGSQRPSTRLKSQEQWVRLIQLITGTTAITATYSTI